MVALDWPGWPRALSAAERQQARCSAQSRHLGFSVPCLRSLDRRSFKMSSSVTLPCWRLILLTNVALRQTSAHKRRTSNERSLSLAFASSQALLRESEPRTIGCEATSSRESEAPYTFLRAFDAIFTRRGYGRLRRRGLAPDGSGGD